MSTLPPKENQVIPRRPFDSENLMSEAERVLLEENRKSSGDLPDQPPDLPVKNTIPYKDLRRK